VGVEDLRLAVVAVGSPQCLAAAEEIVAHFDLYKRECFGFEEFCVMMSLPTEDGSVRRRYEAVCPRNTLQQHLEDPNVLKQMEDAGDAREEGGGSAVEQGGDGRSEVGLGSGHMKGWEEVEVALHRQRSERMEREAMGLGVEVEVGVREEGGSKRPCGDLQNRSLQRQCGKKVEVEGGSSLRTGGWRGGGPIRTRSNSLCSSLYANLGEEELLDMFRALDIYDQVLSVSVSASVAVSVSLSLPMPVSPLAVCSHS
jgi:hypothetical protein